ncbi:MAG: 4a-hydroxytetrahydrobiopterin dehydratase [Planctomycetota bacterium]
MKCAPCEGGTPPMSAKAVKDGLKQLPGWKLLHGAIAKTYSFKDYHQTMAFVNATAWISHRENHHPDLGVYYNKCQVSYHTHAIGGLSQNDFICAAKIEALFNL